MFTIFLILSLIAFLVTVHFLSPKEHSFKDVALTLFLTFGPSAVLTTIFY
jgi:hypothetical protein